MNNWSTNRRGSHANKRTIIAVISCVFGIGLMALGFSAGSSPRAKATKTQNQANVADQKQKKLPTWNMALGNIVMVARELGFSVEGEKGSAVDEDKLASQIEGKIQSLRALYRRESENDPNLMGAMMLDLTVNARGEVTDVNEISSRITDKEFKKAVFAEISQWNFSDLAPQVANIRCPLLFVREGMDITTLVNWEKSLSQIRAESGLPKNAPPPTRAHKPTGTRKVAARDAKTANVATEKLSLKKMAAEESWKTIYQMKYGTTIRKEPSFSSPAVAEISSGKKVTVLGQSGDWLEVRYAEGGPSGYLRKEFLIPVAMMKN